MLALRCSGVVVVRSPVLAAVVLALSMAIAGCPGQSSGHTSDDQASSDKQYEETLAALYPFERMTTREMFKQRVSKADKPTVVIFVSVTCAVCKRVVEQVVELSQEFGDSVDFYVVVKQEAVDVVMAMRVYSFPQVHLFANSSRVDHWEGVEMGGLRAELNRLVGNE